MANHLVVVAVFSMMSCIFNPALHIKGTSYLLTMCFFLCEDGFKPLKPLTGADACIKTHQKVHICFKML